MKYDAESAAREYDKLHEHSEDRYKELSDMYKPFVNITDNYGRLICRITSLLGHIPPESTIDNAIRDLMADVFDGLYESRKMIIGGKCTLAYPLARRAYESLSLMVVCKLNSELAEKWIKGKQLSNSKIREQLGKHPMGENEDMTRELYKFFSEASHPNRSLVPYRYLGDGNSFVLGSIAKPDLLMTTDFCIKLLSLWFWYVAFISYIYNDQIRENDHSLSMEYMSVANEARQVVKWLRENFDRLLKELKDNFPPEDWRLNLGK